VRSTANEASSQTVDIMLIKSPVKEKVIVFEEVEDDIRACVFETIGILVNGGSIKFLIIFMYYGALQRYQATDRNSRHHGREITI
jgi:hypothetical protein